MGYGDAMKAAAKGKLKLGMRHGMRPGGPRRNSGFGKGPRPPRTCPECGMQMQGGKCPTCGGNDNDADDQGY